MGQFLSRNLFVILTNIMERLSRKLRLTWDERNRGEQGGENFGFGLKRSRSTGDLPSTPLGGVSEGCSSSGAPQKPISDSNVIDECSLSSDSNDSQVNPKKRKFKKFYTEWIDTQVWNPWLLELDFDFGQEPGRRFSFSDTPVPSTFPRYPTPSASGKITPSHVDDEAGEYSDSGSEETPDTSTLQPDPFPSASGKITPPHVDDEAGEYFDSGSEIDSDDDDMEIYEGMGVIEVEFQPQQALSGQFNWSDYFNTFTGKKEEFLARAGPSTDASSPYDIFRKIWDDKTMKYIVDKTNHYAWTMIVEKFEFESGLAPSLREHFWKEITVDQLYVFFGMLIYMSTAIRTEVAEYWIYGVMQMPMFTLMSCNRFCLILQFLNSQQLVLQDQLSIKRARGINCAGSGLRSKKVFVRILNTTILNSFVKHLQNDPSATKIDHGDFRNKLASALMRCHKPDVPIEKGVGNDHYPYKLNKRISNDNRRERRNCVLCAARGTTKATTTYCKKCDEALCIEQCFEDYHTLIDISR